MQDLGENMDNLFRTAAENYMLNEGDSNWEDIAAKLHAPAENNGMAQAKTSARRKTSFILLLILFISAGIITVIYYASYEPVSNKNDGKQTAEISAAETGTNSFAKKETLPVSGEVKTNTTPLRLKSVAAAPVNLPGKPVMISVPVSLPLIGKSENLNNQQEDVSGDDLTFTANDSSNARETEIQESIIVETKKKQDSGNNKTRQQILIKKRQQIFYIGIMAGPAFSQVEQQGFTKPGFDIGVIAGYKFRNALSVETGMLYSKKRYFSDGKYFKMDKIGSSMPPDMEVISLNGNTNFIEIPLRFKYDFVRKKRTNIFSTIALSSRILTKEKNDYTTAVNGSIQSMQGLYTKASASFISSIDVSIGYEHLLKKNASLRLEPYVQFPVKGTGVGDMQVISTGLHLSITHSLR